MAKYKVGDKVRIVSERPFSCGFNDKMCKYLGTVMTIRNVIESDNPSYKMEEDKGGLEFLLTRELLGDIADGWVWSEKWISGLAEEPKEQKEAPSGLISVHIRFCGPLTVAELMNGRKVVKVANARCNPKDEYSRSEGARIAVERLFEKTSGKAKDASKPKIGDKFVVVGKSDDMRHAFDVGTIVTLILLQDDGYSRYQDNFGFHQFVSDRDVKPCKEAKK